jgi:hypothetical protein
MMAGGGDVKGKRASDEEADLARRIAEREAEAKKQAGAAAKGAPIRGQGYKKGSEVKESSKDDMNQDKALVKKAFRQHENAEHGGKHVELKLKKGGNFIKDAIKKPGALRAALGAKPGKPIPAGKLAKATKAPGKLGQRARFAEMLKGFKKK